MDDIRELKRRMLKALNEDNNDTEYTPNKADSGVNKEVKDLSVRDMLKLTRNHNANKKKDDSKIQQKISPTEEKEEQDKFENYFKDNNVVVEFESMEVYPYSVFWGGTIDGQIQWVYKVTPDEVTSGVDVNVLEGFQKNDPENEEIIKKLETYYDTFYKYWRDNL